MYDLTSFRYAIKSNTVHHTVSKTQAATRAGVCFKTWDSWESGERQPVNLADILLAIVFNSPPPEPKYNTDNEQLKKHKRSITKEWKKQNPERYREYMREYMRRRRQK